MPSACAAMISRSLFRPAISCIHAWSTCPTTRSSGTKQSVKYMSLTSRPPIVSMPRISRPSTPPGTEIIVNP